MQLSNEIIVANLEVSKFTCAFAMTDSRKHFKLIIFTVPYVHEQPKNLLASSLPAPERLQRSEVP
jgi:hypothetical protein